MVDDVADGVLKGVAVGTGAVVIEEAWDEVLEGVGSGTGTGVDVDGGAGGIGVDIGLGLGCAPCRASKLDDTS